MLRVVRQVALLLLPALMLTVATGCEDKGANPAKRVLVLGCDGMDPKLVRRLIDAGRMPHFAKLERQGGFLPLETSIPPQSPVAWSNFITGAGPGVHGIFDFIHRDPTQQALPYFSTSHDTAGEEPMFTIPIGGYRFSSAEFNPWSKGAATELARRGTPFWDYLDQRGIPVRMYRLPANYPPSKSTHGHVCCLSGMGVPDALGTQGTYQHFTTRPRSEKRTGGGMQFRIRRDFKTKAYVAKLRGPTNEYLDLPESSGSGDPSDEMTIDLNIYRDPDRDVAKIIYTNAGITADQEVEIVLNKGEWSDWQEVHFLKRPVVGPGFGTIARFYLAQVRPELELYVTPLNFNPDEPGATISEPEDFVTEIGSEVGPFYTQGFAEDFKARDSGVFDDAEYKTQADIVLAERFKLLDYALEHFEDGLLFFYFSSSDLQAHIFWWDSNEPHPVRTPEDALKYNAVIEDVYVKMDQALGKCMDALGDEATILVMSDHGFCNFRREFGLNNWLRDEGYLVTQSDRSGHLLNSESDWRQTKAYGLGLNGLYLNLAGREKYGVVPADERDALLDEISHKLLAFRDPDNGRQPIKRVYLTDECYSGPEAKNAPDLIVGYDRDYRASWNTCLSEHLDKAIVSDNRKAWSADHCIAHDVVPGIVLSNKKILVDDPALIDVAPSILREFGVPIPKAMTGKNLFERDDARLARR